VSEGRKEEENEDDEKIEQSVEYGESDSVLMMMDRNSFVLVLLPHFLPSFIGLFCFLVSIVVSSHHSTTHENQTCVMLL
jgi:hypothetical protein